MDKAFPWRFGPRIALLLGVAVVSGGCRAPIGATRTTTRQAYAQFTQSALNGKISDYSTLVLHRFDLVKTFARDPDRALGLLHDRVVEDSRRDSVFALAELSYVHAEKLRRSVRPGEPARAHDVYLAAAIYSHWFLLGDGPEPPPDPFDRRFRFACDLHNHALGHAFRSARGTNEVVAFASGSRPAPQGTVRVRVNPGDLADQMDAIDYFLAADEFRVRGLSVRDRRPGLGAPLIVVDRPPERGHLRHMYPATAFLRLKGSLASWRSSGIEAIVELHSGYGSDEVQVGDRAVPLETDFTTPVAYALNDKYVWTLGRSQFFSHRQQIRTGIYLSQPYDPGRVPVLLVHGTLSSPVWWAEMVNTLRADAMLRDRCQFWYFVYNSGNPVSLSANYLRDEFEATLQLLDPDATDPALRRAVIVGHSQGGLLAKLTAVATSNRLWRATLAAKPRLQRLDPAEIEALRPHFEFSPLAGVDRVVFIATPHRGSYLAKDWIRRLARRFISLPTDLVGELAKVLHPEPETRGPRRLRRSVPTSLDLMAPTNPWLLALAEIPVAEGIESHSIIPVTDGEASADSSDGVVKYASAHVSYADSELVVKSWHSCQERPAVIEEVRRILLEHLAGIDGANGTRTPSDGANPAP